MTKDQLWQQWDQEGLAAAKAFVLSERSNSQTREWTHEWIFREETAIQSKKDDEQRELSLKSLHVIEYSADATRLSAKATQDAAAATMEAAEHARRSARWTAWAAVIATLGIALNLAQSLGWLDWAKHITPPPTAVPRSAR